MRQAWWAHRPRPPRLKEIAVAFEIRRVVTGHDDDGNAIVRQDEFMRSQERLPVYQVMTLWCTSELPVNNDESAFNTVEPGLKGQRVLLSIGEMGLDAHSASVLHSTDTLAYAVVLSA